MKNFGVYASDWEGSLLKDNPDELLGDFLNVETMNTGLVLIWYVADDGIPVYARREDVYLKEIPNYGPC